MGIKKYLLLGISMMLLAGCSGESEKQTENLKKVWER